MLGGVGRRITRILYHSFHVTINQYGYPYYISTSQLQSLLMKNGLLSNRANENIDSYDKLERETSPLLLLV